MRRIHLWELVTVAESENIIDAIPLTYSVSTPGSHYCYTKRTIGRQNQRRSSRRGQSRHRNRFFSCRYADNSDS